MPLSANGLFGQQFFGPEKSGKWRLGLEKW